MSDLGFYSNLGWNPDLFGDQTNINSSNVGNINEVNEASTDGKISTDGDLWRYNNGQVEPLNRGLNNQLLESTSNNINWTSDINVNSVTTPLIQNSSYIDVESTTARTIFRVKSNEDSAIHIVSDMDNEIETDNPRLVLTQDGGNIGGILSVDDRNNTNLMCIGVSSELVLGNTANMGHQNIESTILKPSSYPAIKINNVNNTIIKNGLFLKNEVDDPNPTEPNGTATTALTFYRQISYTEIFTFPESGDTSTGTVNLSRIGNIVCIHTPAIAISGQLPTLLTTNEILPVWSRPSSTVANILSENVNIIIQNDGNYYIDLQGNASAVSFPSSSTCYTV